LHHCIEALRLDPLAEPDTLELRQRWQAQLQHAAYQLFDQQFVGAGPVERQHPRRVAEARRRLGYALCDEILTALRLPIPEKPPAAAARPCRPSLEGDSMVNVSSGINPSEKPWPSGGKAWRTIAQAGYPAPRRRPHEVALSAPYQRLYRRLQLQGWNPDSKATLMTVSPLLWACWHMSGRIVLVSHPPNP
jgi:hypothetical protein